jgi:hypothetical protein
MATRVKINRTKKSTRDIRRVHATHDQNEANKMMAAGWVLLHGGVSHLDNYGLNVKPVFVLGEP